MAEGGDTRPRDRYRLPSVCEGGAERAVFPGARCVGSGLNFFPTKEVRGRQRDVGKLVVVADESEERVAPLRHLCVRCEWARECLLHALACERSGGVWGGTTDKERRRLLQLVDTDAQIARRCPDCGGVNTWRLPHQTLWNCGGCSHTWR